MMISFLLRRTALLLLTVLLASMLIFLVTRYLPGDVARVMLGREAGESALQALRAELGLDRPLVVQYLSWLAGFVRGDWGESFSTSQPIRDLLLPRLSRSLQLAGLTLAITVPLALLLGVVAALYQDRWPDAAISVGSLSVVGLPEFVTGLLLIEIFSFRLGWLPASASLAPGVGFVEAFPALVLPAATASLVLLAYVVRLTRASVVVELRQPYLRTALLKGMRYRSALLRHVLPNALLPTVTVVALSVGWLVSGLVVVENVFNYPGLGRLLIFAIDRRDLPLLQAVVMVATVIFAVANLTADLLYAMLNPRVRPG